MNRMLIPVVLGLCAAFVGHAPAQTTPPRTASLTGNIILVKDFESKVLGNKRDLRIYLPPGYEKNPKQRYSVLYVNDGQNAFDGATSYIPNQEWRLDETAEALISAGLIEPIIMVAIDNAGVDRAEEYLPTKISMGKTKVGGRADRYAAMVLEEIKPMIDKTYRTRPDRAHTGMIGSSFGGVITMHMGLTHSDAISKLAIVSPSIWVDNRVLLKRLNSLPAKLPLKIWLDMGRTEGGGLKDAQDTAEGFQKLGWKTGRDFAYYEDGFANHSEVAWARRVPAILMFLFGRRSG